MARYRVSMTAIAYVKGHVFVNAESEEQAKTKAKENLGDAEWQYDGNTDDEPAINNVEVVDGG